MVHEIISIIDGKTINKLEIEGDWQQLALKKLQLANISDENIEAQYKAYNCGVYDGLKLALTLRKSKNID